MANLVVGDDDCTFQDIVKIFQHSPCCDIVLENWRSFARSLNTSRVIVMEKSQQLFLNTFNVFDVIEELLVEWRSRISKNATLGELLRIVESELHWNEIAMSIRNVIKDRAKRWADLDESSKSRIYAMEIIFQGRQTSLKSLETLVGKDKLEKIVFEYLTGDLFEKSLRNESWSLDNWNVLERPPYYIKRKLKLRNQLNPKIFEQKCSDIFVFEGISHPNLSILLESETTDVSGNQLECISVRFIILELKSDFKVIEKLARSPIHRIKFETGVYNWISTIGSTKLIKKFLMEEYEEFSEEEFVIKRLSHFTSRPTSIVDSAGMGKSMLLNSIASNVQSVYTERIILFITIRELIETIKHDEESDSLDFQRTIAKAASSTPFGIKVISELMTNSNTEFEIFLDGFDEVSQQDLNILRQFLNHVLKHKNMRAHVTSRLYMQTELEDTFQVVPLNIVAFSEQDQLKFLNDFWNSKFIPGNQDRLNEFAFKCLVSIQNIIKDGNKDIAGIPLQCYILSEVYKKDAMRYADEGNTSDKVRVGLKSVLELYTKFVDQKFQKVTTVDQHLLKLVHYYYALILLFPHSERMIATKYISRISVNVPSSIIYSIGIINAETSNGTLEFQHRTFAEFLLAEYLTIQLPNIFDDYELCNFFFNEVLEVTKTTHGVALTDFIVERFIDVFESEFKPRNRTKQYHHLKSTLISDPARRMVLDSAYIERSSVKGLINYWIYVNETIPLLHSLLNKLRIDLGWLKLADDFEELCVKDYRLEYQNSSLCYFMNAILSATENSLECMTKMKSGEFQIFEDTSQQFVIQSFACAAHNFLSLFHLLECWFHNQALDMSVVSKTWHQILVCAAGHDDVTLYKSLCDFLLQVCNKNWLENQFPTKTFMHTQYVHTPLHESVQRGNYSMTEHLLQHYEIKTFSKTPLFFHWVTATSTASKSVLKSKFDICPLLFQKDQNLLNEIDVKECMVGLLGSNVKFLELIIDLECEKNCVKLLNSLVDSVFPFASSDEVDNLVEHMVSKKLTHILFQSAKSGLNEIQWCLACDTLKPETMLHILKSNPFNIAKLNTTRFYILDCSFKSKWSESWIKSIVESYGIDVNFLGRKKKGLLHYAAKHRNVKTIRYLVNIGAGVNAKCKRGYTPSQYVLFPKKLDDLDLLAECTSLLIPRIN